MLTRLLAAAIVAALGAGAGFYYAFSDATGHAGCSSSAEGAIATSEGSCCAAKHAAAKAKMSCCAGTEAAESCPSGDALAACTGGLTFAVAPPATAGDALAACTGGVSAFAALSGN